MTRASEDTNRRLLRARDRMDRSYADPLDVPGLAATSCMSRRHFLREFQRVFGETPYRYLQRRRIERAMFLLRSTDTSVTDVCMVVGFSSLGTFSRTFTAVVGSSPRAYRSAHPGSASVPTSFVMRWGRPSALVAPGTFGEAPTARSA